MWDHCKASLYGSTTDTLSKKQREAIVEQVEIEIRTGSKGLQSKDASTICFDKEKILHWDTHSLETWLKHVKMTRQQLTLQHLKRRFDNGDGNTDNVYTQRYKRLKRSLSPCFVARRMKYNYKTLDIYLRSMKDFKKCMEHIHEQIIEWYTKYIRSRSLDIKGKLKSLQARV